MCLFAMCLCFKGFSFSYTGVRVKVDNQAFFCSHLTRNVYAVWRSYLEGTVQVSQSRLNVCDNYKSKVSEPAKAVRLYKEQQLKKVGEYVSLNKKLSWLLIYLSHFHVTNNLHFFSSSQIIDQLSCIQAELQESVKELVKAKKKYYDSEQVAHAVREKADIEAK